MHMDIKDFTRWLENEWKNTSSTLNIERLDKLQIAWDIVLEYLKYIQDKQDKINADCKDMTD